MAPRFWTGFLLGIVGAMLAAVAGWLVIVYGGLYNVAASDPHADVVRWTLQTSLRRSVERRAGAIEPPEQAEDAVVQRGARLYAEDCAQCHGRPGGEAEAWAAWMRPEPPKLTQAATEWSGGEIAWIVTNGLKMTGMPAFGEEHDAEEIAALAAFVQTLPGLAAADYERMSAQTAEAERENSAAAAETEPAAHESSDGAGTPAPQ